MRIVENMREIVSRLIRRTDESATVAIDPDNQQAAIVSDWQGQIFQSYENLAGETYLKNSTTFSCIDRIAHGVGSIPWEVVKRNSDGGWEYYPAHPLSSVIGYAPNPVQTASEFYYDLVATLMIGGKVYIEKVAPQGGFNAGIPKELYVHRTDRIIPKLDKNTGRLISYEYIGYNNQRKIFPVDPITFQSNIKEIKRYNPINKKFMGSPAAAALFREIDTLNASVVWNKALLNNSAKSGMTVIVSGNIMTQDAVNKLQKQLNQNADIRKTGKIQVIPIGGNFSGPNSNVNIVKDSWSPSELDFSNSQWDLKRAICGGLDVPCQILGIPGETKFANYAEAVRWFWESTILGTYAKLIRDIYNQWLFPADSNIQIRYNIDNLPAFAEKRARQWERIRNADFLTINEKRKELGFAPLGPEGDVLLVPAGMLPLSIVAGSPEEFESEVENELKEIDLPERQKEEYLQEIEQYAA